MAEKDNIALAAAIMTLSEGLDAVCKAMRQTLSFQVTETGHKIPESFLPKPLESSEERFARWKQHIEQASSQG
jgi:hypothetical protein